MSKINTFSQSQSQTEIRSRNANLMYYIVTDNYQEFYKLITEANVDQIIDPKNGFTALHYAIKSNNEKMVKYLLDMGSNPYLKTVLEKDSLELAMIYHCKSLIIKLLNDKDEMNKELTKTIATLEKKCVTLTENNKYLAKSVEDSSVKNGLLKVETNELKSQVISLKEEVVTSKRKYTTLDESYTKLVNKMRK